MRANVIDRENVRMIERAGSASFLFKAMQPIGIGRESRRQNLDSDISSQPCVAGAIHLTHSARSQGRKNFIGTEFCARSDGHDHVSSTGKMRTCAETGTFYLCWAKCARFGKN